MIINQTYSGGGIELSLVISVASGSVVTATKGGKSVTGMAVDGVCVLVVPEAGTWTVSATLGGKTTPAKTVTVKSQWEAALVFPTPAGELDIGSSVFLNVDGAPVEFLVVHQGLPSSIYDASCDGTWFLMKGNRDQVFWSNNSSNQLEYSLVHRTLNESWPTRFDSAVQALIKQVKIPYNPGGYTTTVNSGESGMSTKLFLLSVAELGWTTSNNSSISADGAVLSFFSGANNGKRICYDSGGTARAWWTRSASAKSRNGAFLVTTSGYYDNVDVSVESARLRPALILPSSTEFNPDGTISA